MKRIVYLIIIVAVLSSCIPQRYIEIESLQPAKSALPKDVEGLLVLNGSYLPGSDTSANNQLNYLKSKEQYIVDTIIIDRIFDGLFYVFDQSPAPVLQSSKYAEFRVEDTTSFLKPYDVSYINQLCSAYGTNYVLSFEYYSFSFDKYASYVSDVETELVLGMKRKLIWRLYKKDSGVMDKYTVRDTLYWSSTGYGRRSAEMGLPEYLDVIKESFWYAGYDFAKRYSPYWEEDNRSYFYLYNKQGQDISLKKEELLKILKDGTNIKKFKSAYNLALVSEINNDLNSAIKYIEIALSLRPSSEYAKFYKRKLEKKQTVYKQLESKID